MADVFISYARADREWVERLAGEIQRAGLSVWWDRDLAYGRSFEKIIEAELDNAKAIVVVWSAASLGSDWVKDEATNGRQRGVLIPVLKEKIAPPLGFKQLHAADLARWPDEDQREFVKLLGEIGALTGHDLKPIATLGTTRVAPAPPSRRPSHWRMRFLLGGLVVAALAAVATWVMLSREEPAPGPSASPSSPPAEGIEASGPARARLMQLQTEGGRIAGLDISGDDARIVALGEHDGAYLWDAKTGAEIGRLGARSSGAFVAFSGDGSRVATASLDRALVFDGRDGTAIGSAGVTGGQLAGAALSPDGKRLVTLAVGAAQLWNADASALIAILGDPAVTTMAAAFSPNGAHIATASADFTARLWDAATGAPQAMLAGHENTVTSVAFSADGKRVVSTSEDGTAIVWDVLSGERVALLGFHDDDVRAARFSPDGLRVATLVADGTLCLWTVTGDKIACVGADLADAVFSADGAHLVALDAGGGIHLWNGATGAAEADLPAPAGPPPTALRLSRDATRLLMAREGTVSLERIEPGTR